MDAPTIRAWRSHWQDESDAAFLYDELAKGEGDPRRRETYEGLAGFWPTQEGPWAELINPLPKFVASRTLSGPLQWDATVLEGELDAAIPRLKEESAGDLVMSGCGELARDLLQAGLLDEIRLWLHPVVWGKGTRPFEGRRTSLHLLETRPFDSGVTLLRYEPR